MSDSHAGADGDATNDIAIVGIATHLPGAHTPGEFWTNLRDGVESIVPLSDDDLAAAGVSTDVLRRPGYVKSAAVLDGVYDFDAEFFGFSPKEAGILDPQHRHFLMAVWEALEDAGQVPERFDGAIGVFAGCGTNSYYVYNILTNPDLVRDVGLFLLRHTGNDKDFLATRASYLFDLRGPAVNVQTACSTSLVATHLAVQHLLSGEVDLALAGGVTIEVPHGHGYQYLDGEILSPDGHCRAFDHQSQGTVFGSGVGVVALRRLDDALADGDHIYAVIKATAVNNDGTQKVGYLAPSVDGQAACIAEALGVADVDPDSLAYVECHGTGTPMGDPIEVAALTQAFRGASEFDDDAQPIGIGSVKTNIGHLDTAAGVAALAKVALSLHHGEIPPSLNFEAPNPLLELESSPFDVVRTRSPWPQGKVRRAGVNSLGVGGTNAFAILEEAPGRLRSASPVRWRLLTLSARTRGALDGASSRLAAHFADDDVDLGDAAWTLREGRRAFAERRVVAARTATEAAELLVSGDPRRVFSHTAGADPRRIALLFPGGGAQHLGMAAGLYAAEPEFRRHIDAGLDELRTRHGIELRSHLLDAEPRTADRVHDFELMTHQLPGIFLVEYALAQLLISWGVEFDALAGHSVGENTAACVAGTISFSDCLGLVVLRGQLMDRVGGGAVAVPLPPDEVAAMAGEFDLDLAVINAPDLAVVSGELEVLARFEDKVRATGTEPQRVRLNVAAHSRVLDPILPEFRAYLDSITLSAPRIRWVSNRTGTWITDEQACDPGYWVEHLRNTVRFADCITALAAEPGRVLLEVGPGKTLSSLARMNPELKAAQPAIPTMRHADEEIDDEAALIGAIGRLWATGYEFPGTLDARLFDDDGRAHQRISLPTYAFQTQRYFIAPGTTASAGAAATTYVDRDADVDRWYWEPIWRSHDADVADDDQPGSWLVFDDDAGIGRHLVEQLRARGSAVVVVRHGDSYQAVSDDEYVIAPENGVADYEALVSDLVRTGRVPERIAHLSLIATDDRQYRPGSSFFHRNQELGFQGLVGLAKAWARAGIVHPVHLTVVTMCSQRVVASDVVQWPEQAAVLGPVGVIPREFPGFTVTAVDIDQRDLFPESRLRTRLDLFADKVAIARSDGLGAAVRRVADPAPLEPRVPRREGLLDALLAELTAAAGNAVVALRGDRRYVRDVRRTSRPVTDDAPAPALRRGGVVLITGGLGGIGLTVAEELVATADARIALLSRNELPPRDTWADVVERLGELHPTSERIRGVERLEAAGAEVLLLSGDVTDITQMRRVTADVRAAFGAIHGIVHAAGVVADELIVAKPIGDMDDVLAPKVYGTTVLDEVTHDDQLDMFVVFSSTSTVSTPIGQVDYVAANAFLNSWVESRRAIGRSEVTAVNWGVWNEVGMAAGVLREDAPTGGPTTTPAVHPWFDDVTVDGRGVARIHGLWNSGRDWFLDEHRTAAGASLLPGTAYPELARASLAEIGVRQPFTLRNLTFLRPLPAPDGVDVRVRLELTPTESGYDLVVSEGVTVASPTADDSAGGGRAGWRPVAQASLQLRALPVPEPLDLASIRAATPDREPTRTSQQDHLRFGPRWDVVERVTSGGGRAVATLRLADEFAADLTDVLLHPGLLDLATGFAMSLVDGYSGDRLWVPVSYGAIRVHDRLMPRLTAVATARRGSSEQRGFARFDITICDDDGRVLVDIDEFTIKRLDGTLDVGNPARVLASEVTFDAEPAATRARSQSELVLQHNVSQGIVPEEGRVGFARAVGSGLPVVYVSSMDLHALRRQADSAAAAQGGAGSDGASAVFGRPDLASEYVAPRNELEENLVGIWQELLGIDEVGVHDNFFDLGGHSLIAVRLFTRVKRTFSVDFPISVLFEAPTVADIAGLIAAALPADSGDEGTDASGTIADAPARFDHLVPMHLGEGGARTPFFLVAGMFGNVMNLRHLAHLIGTDRPFYGVQARGLFGGAAPHETFVEMATDYLAEVRRVQPTGPYLLGGFSGGGIAAYEMAQQLIAAGEEVALLVLLDTPLADNDPLYWLDRLKIQRDNLQEKGVSYVKEWAVNRVRWERERRRRTTADDASADGALHSSEIEAAFYRALERYDTKRYDGTITLYRPPLSPLHVFGPDRQVNIDRRFIFEDNGWSRWCDDVDVTEVPGTHDSMVLEPNVRVLARHLRSTIESVEDR